MNCIFWYSTSSQTFGSNPAFLPFVLPVGSGADSRTFEVSATSNTVGLDASKAFGK
jgi:hypothetical protein